MIEDPRIRQLLQNAIRPSEAEIVRARSLILEQLAAGTIRGLERLVGVVFTDFGVADLPPHDTYVDLGPVQRDPSATFDLDDPLVKRERLRSAVYEALAQLNAEGVLMAADPSRTDATINVGSFTGGTGRNGRERVPTDRPKVADGYKLSARWVSSPAVTEIATAVDASGLETLLGERGVRCWEEAIAAFSRGLYLAAAGLIGAASEAAWYAIGEAISDDQRLAKPLAGDNTVQVFKLVAERLRQAPRSEATVNELQAHAAYLRDLRNYGLHPRSDHDTPREAAFTETGCLVLLMESRRYLIRLLDIARDAGILRTH